MANRDGRGRFLKGYTANALGGSKLRGMRVGLSESVREQEGKKFWRRLLEMRDGLIQEASINEKGETVYSVPSIKQFIQICELGLAYCYGRPSQRIEIPSGGTGPVQINFFLGAKMELNLDFTLADNQTISTAGRYLKAIVNGEANEYALFGIRGDGKTQASLAAIVGHARVHEQKGFPLPVPWMGVRDTHTNHKTTTLKSLANPLWQGCWHLYDDSHLAVFKAGEKEYVHLQLMGVENAEALDRLRQETVGVWFQEAAPVAQESTGISDTAWRIACSSQRVPSYSHPAIQDLNYPDEDHGTWQRFVTLREPGTMFFRIPPRENKHMDPRYWVRLEMLLASRPDLKRRLLDGQPGTVMLGALVAEGFNEDKHVSKERLKPVRGEPFFIGFDFGHTPTAIIGQQVHGQVRVYAALACEHGGVRQHLRDSVIPWFTHYAPGALREWNMILGGYDPSGNTQEQADIDQSPILVLETMLPGTWEEGAISWAGRQGPMLEIFNRGIAGEPALVIDPVDGFPLIKALRGAWYYPTDKFGKVSRDLPKKPNHPHEDIGDAFCYFVGRVAPGAPKYNDKNQEKTFSKFDPRFDGDIAGEQYERFDPRQ